MSHPDSTEMVSLSELRDVPVERVRLVNPEGKYFSLRDYQRQDFRHWQGKIHESYYFKEKEDRLYYVTKGGKTMKVVAVDIRPSTYATRLLYVYKEDYRFPLWALENLEDPETQEMMSQVRVFYSNFDDLSKVKKLVEDREPVNIMMKTDKYFNRPKFLQLTGRDSAAYHNMEKPPNFAIYAPVWVNLTGEDFSPKTAPGVLKKFHILNAIGLALDAVDQPDYKRFVTLENEQRKTWVTAFYRRLFHLIFQATEKLGKKYLCMSLVGANNFASLYNDGEVTTLRKFQRKIWWLTFRSVAVKYKQIGYVFMGAENTGIENLVDNRGYFPADFSGITDGVREDMLFVNAWDPFSIAGNGNLGDDSLDGWIGRSTNVGLSTLPAVNRTMKSAGTYIPLNIDATFKDFPSSFKPLETKTATSLGGLAAKMAGSGVVSSTERKTPSKPSPSPPKEFSVEQIPGGSVNVAYDMSVKHPKTRIGILIAGNLARPGGAVGNSFKGTIDSTKLKLDYKTQEEAVLSNLLLTSFPDDPKAMDRYYAKWRRQWGLMYSNPKYGNKTWQGPDYTRAADAEAHDFAWSPQVGRTKLSYEVNDSAGNKELDRDRQFAAALVFVGAANAGDEGKDETSSMRRSFSKKAVKDYAFFRATVMLALRRGLLLMVTKNITVAVLSKIGTGLYAGPWKKRIRAEFSAVLDEALNFQLQNGTVLKYRFEEIVIAKV